MIRNIQNALVFIFLYLPPLVFFLRSSLRRRVNKLLLFIISILYLGLALYTQNLLPFIMIIINIRFIRQQDAEMREIYSSDFLDVSKDYYRYNFNIKSFKVLKGLKYAVQTYAVTISINIIVTLIISLLKLNLEQQEIVTELQKVPLNRFVYMIPIMVIFAPIVEEFTFRWLFYAKVFKPRLGVYGAALLSSILFSLVHFNIRVFPVLIAIGLINCYLVEKKGYWYAVFNHLVFNSISVVAMIIQKIN